MRSWNMISKRSLRYLGRLERRLRGDAGSRHKLIEKIRRNEEIWENIAEVTVLEYHLS